MHDRVIFHSDLNCFYASVEMVLNPELRGKPLAVCGSKENRHGIVLAKSEEAKRAGVKTGMVNGEARRLCPDLIIVQPQFSYYEKYSRTVRQIYQEYTDAVEPFGMDECWLDMTGCLRPWKGDARAAAEEIRLRVREETGLTVSIGVSFNKVFAKLGSDMKKPDAITVLDREHYREKVWGLPVEDLLFVGRATASRLHDIGVETIGDLAKLPARVPQQLLGVNGEALWRAARGEENAPVIPCRELPAAKSVGHGTTCREDLVNNDEVWRVIFSLTQEIGTRLRQQKLNARSVEVSVKGKDFSVEQYRAHLPYPTSLVRVIARCAQELFAQRYHWRVPVRAVTVTAVDLVDQGQEEQLDLMTDYGAMQEMEELDRTVDALRARFGTDAVSYGVLMQNDKISPHPTPSLFPGAHREKQKDETKKK